MSPFWMGVGAGMIVGFAFGVVVMGVLAMRN